MKKITRTIFGAVLLMAGLNANAQENLFLNGSFETLGETSLPTDWELSGNSTLVTDAHDGMNSLQFVAPGGIAQVAAGVEANEIYTLSFWYKYKEQPAGEGLLSYSSSWWDADGNEYFGEGEFELMNATVPYADQLWLPLTVDITAQPLATQFWLGLGAQTGVTVLVDDVKLVKKAVVGVDEFNTSLNMYTEGNTVYVSTIGGESIEIYNLAGQKVAEAKGESKVTVLNNLPQNQVLIVRVDARSAKIVSGVSK
jgi:hypothetical protein